MELAIDLEELMTDIAIIYMGLGFVCLCIDIFAGWLEHRANRRIKQEICLPD